MLIDLCLFVSQTNPSAVVAMDLGQIVKSGFSALPVRMRLEGVFHRHVEGFDPKERGINVKCDEAVQAGLPADSSQDKPASVPPASET